MKREAFNPDLIPDRRDERLSAFDVPMGVGRVLFRQSTRTLVCREHPTIPIMGHMPAESTKGVHPPWEAGDASSPQILVVMYHYVREPESGHPCSGGFHPGIHALSPSEFERQLDQLSAVMEPIDWPTLYAWTCGRRTIPERSFLLTFDDGLADHAETVLPILQDRGLRGVFFVPGSILSEHRMLSAHAVHLLMSILGGDALGEEVHRCLHGRGFGDAMLSESEAVAADAMYHYEEQAVGRLKYLLTMKLRTEVRSAMLDELFEQHVGSSARWARHWYLGWDDLIHMQSLGHTIGGHGYQHEPYERLTPSHIQRDIRQAAAILREGLGPEVRPFSYPFGSITPQVGEFCTAADFVHGFTTRRAWLRSESDPTRFPRFDTIAVDAALEKEMGCRPTCST